MWLKTSVQFTSINVILFSKRPPRRAAIRARETVNFLHGNVENGLELRGTRKALEKADMSEEEQSDEEKMVQDSSFLSNSDLFDADSVPGVDILTFCFSFAPDCFFRQFAGNFRTR